MELKYEVRSKQEGILMVYDDRLIITQRGKIKGYAQAYMGEITIFFTDIISYQFRNSGWATGYMEISYPGSEINPVSKKVGINNKNTFTFGSTSLAANKALAAEVEVVNQYILKKLEDVKMKKLEIEFAKKSIADELMKFKQLLDQGAIDQEEFDKKKKELLG
jgi:hypothetical protein